MYDERSGINGNSTFDRDSNAMQMMQSNQGGNIRMPKGLEDKFQKEVPYYEQF